MSCETPYFSGLGNCQKLLAKVAGVGITLKGTTFTDATFIAEATWKAGISTSTAANRNTIIFPLKVYEKTTDDPQVDTSNLGIKDVTNKPAPSMVGYLDCGPSDYKAIHDLAGTKFDVVLFLADGTQVGTRKSDGSIKGFRAKLETRADLPLADGAQNSYPLYLFFRDAKEFEEMVLVAPDYTLYDLIDYVPVGLDLKVGALSASTGQVSITVYKRGTTQPLTGLVVADVTVLESSGTATVGSTVLTEVGQGVYTLTIQEDTGGTGNALEAGEWAKIQVAKIASTFITYMSEVVKVTAT
jgi:hypothetical protein